MKPKRQRASEILEKFVDRGVPDSALLEYILNNHMSGDEALDGKSVQWTFGSPTDTIVQIENA